MDISYCYKNTDVLENKLNIHDPIKFKSADRKLTMLRIMDLLRNPVQGKFDTIHLCKIHEYIFQDLYTWAGKIRTVEIAKGTYFCKSDYIVPMLKKIFDELKKENYLQGYKREQLIQRIAYYISEINAIHPFREGNGRTQREFIRELALINNATLHFGSISKSEMLKASIESFRGDNTLMELLIRKSIIF